MRTLLFCAILFGLTFFMISMDGIRAQDSEETERNQESAGVAETTKNGFVDPALLEIITVEFAADPYSRANYDPFIKLRVFNNSPEVLTRVFIDVEFTADEGNHKLFRDKFVQIINGGMRPFSTAVWKFYPRGSSAIALKGLPRDTKISASVNKVFCPKKNSPWQYEHKFNYPARHDFAW